MKTAESKLLLPEQDRALRLFHRGNSMQAYNDLGFHRVAGRARFRVWAPHAEYASVIGDFNQWDSGAAPMHRITKKGVWEVELDSDLVRDGQNYKFLLRNGCRTVEKADPYGFCSEKPPKTASVICDIDGYRWRDAGWMRYRKGRFTRDKVMKQPINIYEVHAGSWKRHGDGTPYSYTELAADLVSYVKQMGYTHIELMPLAEYPYDGSWGYQVCGYFAPTARYGKPKDLMHLVDMMHEAGIGVILDWVPAHFPKDAHGLYEFDGQPLYEYRDPTKMQHPSWGTRCFDLGREEVQSFLISNAAFWIEKYHIDGLRVDAVASMLYLDFDRKPGEWVPNPDGSNRDLEAAAFLKKLNTCLARSWPDVMTIAEESAAWKGLTGFADGGLGFSLKWNMGWMNDGLSYLSTDLSKRSAAHNKLNFSITYAFDEHYVLPISHDEVVHGKRSLLDRNPGEYEQKFAGFRAFLLYMMTHPGKKLLFMGSEIGQFCEWNHANQTEWFLLDYKMHAAAQLFCAELNHLYLEYPALWEGDAEPGGFSWIDADNAAQSIFSYRRIDAKGEELAVLLNFSATGYSDYLLALPYKGIWEEVLSTDYARFGGTNVCNPGPLLTQACTFGAYQNAIRIKVPPLCGMIFRCKRKTQEK